MFMGKFFWQRPQDLHRYANLNFLYLGLFCPFLYQKGAHRHDTMQANAAFVWD